MALAGLLKADEAFVPPERRRPAGRPPKQRKERSWLRTTDVQCTCASCGEAGHFQVSCKNPKTQHRWFKHKDGALTWCKNEENLVLEQEMEEWIGSDRDISEVSLFDHCLMDVRAVCCLLSLVV